mgnify:CR=1 FL=1
MDEDFTRKSTCLLCDAKVDPKFEVQICSTCAIIAMSDQDFRDLDYISLIENVKSKSINDKERKRILDWYVSVDGLRLI